MRIVPICALLLSTLSIAVGCVDSGDSTNAPGQGGTGGATASAGGSAAVDTGGASAGGNTSSSSTSTAYRPCPTDGSACKIMPFGDSITDGYNASTPAGYRVELFRLAHAAGKNITFVGNSSNGPATVDGIAFPPNHEGHSGYTIDPTTKRSGISPLVATVMPKFTPHIVLLMIGTNDCIDDYDLVNAPTRLETLIDSIYAQLPDVLLVVAEPVPSRGDGTKDDDTALSARIEAYNATIPAVVLKKANAGKHIALVDMYKPFAADKANLMADQWHPNQAGYVIIGTQWYTAIADSL